MEEQSMQAMPHQLMGYDRAITMFSPDGRLLQVEYARKTVKQGSTTIGLVCKDGVVLVADKRILDKLIVTDSIEKIWKIDDHIAATASGIISDARVLISRAQVKAAQHAVTYDSPIDVFTIVDDVASLKQICTQSGGLRPFGVSTLIAGVDKNGPRLFEIDPTGIFFQYHATCVGEAETEVEEILEKEYNQNMLVEDGLKLGLSALMRVLQKKFSSERIDAAIIPIDGKLTKIEKSKIDKLSREAKKEM